MNYITFAMVALSAIPVVIGLLLGLLRGTRRALLRLILLLISVGLAFALTGVVTTAVMNVQIASVGGSLKEVLENYLLSILPESIPQSVVEYITPLAQCLLQVVVFLLLFVLSMFLTWAIAYPLCKLFVKKGNKPRRLIGLAIGAVQGIVVALVVCVVFTGLLVQTNNILATANDLQSIGGEAQATVLSDGDIEDDDTGNVDPDYTVPDDGSDNGETANGGAMEDLGQYLDLIGDYANSPLGQFYTSIGSKPFNFITQVKLEDGSKITLSGQIDAIRGVVSMAKELAKLQDIDFTHLFAEGNLEALKDIFDSLDAINRNLSDESKATINNLFNALAGEMASGMGFDLDDVSITDIDFAKEGEVFSNLAAYKNKDKDTLTVEDADDIIDNLVESDIILGVLQKQDGINIGSQFDDNEHGQIISDKIDSLEEGGVEQSKIDALRHIFLGA